MKNVKGKVTNPVHPDQFTATTTTKTGKWQKDLNDFHLHQQVWQGAIEYFHQSFKLSGSLLDLEDENSVIIKDPYDINENSNSEKEMGQSKRSLHPWNSRNWYKPGN